VPAHPDISFRISRPVPVDFPEVGSVRYRAGFENWDDPGAFVIQLEEATGYVWDRGVVDWSPIARFDHLRPHDVLDPDEGVHIDVYRRDEPADRYTSVTLEKYPSERNPKALFFNLQRVFRMPPNVTVLLEYYIGKRPRIQGDEITFPR
jgi:hypothetical protein